MPQNGRTFEAYGEDPYLAGRLAAANVQGIQSQGILANVKHYAANNQESMRNSVNAEIDERTLAKYICRRLSRPSRRDRLPSSDGRLQSRQWRLLL